MGSEGVKYFPILGYAPGLNPVPWKLLELHAMNVGKVHGGQSLERLASRGGLSVHEVLLVTSGAIYGEERRQVLSLPLEEAVVRVNALVASWASTAVDAARAEGHAAGYAEGHAAAVLEIAARIKRAALALRSDTSTLGTEALVGGLLLLAEDVGTLSAPTPEKPRE